MTLKNELGLAALTTLVASGLVWLFRPNMRQQIVNIALGEVGKARPETYWVDTLGYNAAHKEWCGSFILWVLHQAGLVQDWKWIVGKGFLYRLPTTLLPQPGDIAYFTKYQHQALVATVNGDMITTINGNDANKNVSLSKPFSKSSVTAFYSIEGILK